MVVQVQLHPLEIARVPIGGQSTIVARGPFRGGFLMNPQSSADQGLAVAENLFINLYGLAELGSIGETRILAPGETMSLPEGFQGTVNVNAASSGHKFSGVIFKNPFNFVASTAPFPPPGPTTLTETLPSYLYIQYADDEDLQAFIRAYNSIAQDYVDWFVNANLPVYTALNSTLLDWVAAGLYGMTRPALPSGRSVSVGPLNTWMLNTIPLNDFDLEGPSNYYLTNDDLFKRILTWHLYKGDQKLFNVRWLKRRVKRWLTGTDGSSGDVDHTYDISVTFGVDHQVNINLQSVRRYARGGAIMGAGMLNTFQMNELITDSVQIPVSPYVEQFAAAVETGVLELPFQYDWVVNIIK